MPEHILDPVQELSASLTKLSISFEDPPNDDELAFPAGHAISTLTSLQSLEVTKARLLQPAVLQRLTGLTELLLVNTPLAPRPGRCAAAAAELLAFLPRLQGLRRLSLRGSLQATAQFAAADEDSETEDDESDVDSSEDGGDEEQPAAAPAAEAAEAAEAAAAEAAAAAAARRRAAAAAAPAPEAFAALTFPTLELLDLADCCLPAAAPAHMFRADLQMPQLQVLRLAGDNAACAFGGSQLQKLLRDSPKLQDLAISGHGNIRLPVTLTKLHISGTSNSIAYHVAELTRLRSLSVVKCSFTDRAMLALAVLTQLTELRVESGSFSENFQAGCVKSAAEGWNYTYHRSTEVRS
jgi:hypothetical protein